MAEAALGAAAARSLARRRTIAKTPVVMQPIVTRRKPRGSVVPSIRPWMAAIGVRRLSLLLGELH